MEELLKVWANKDNTKFRIGLEEEEFNMCSDENICDAHILDEEQITEIQQGYGATTIYWDCSKDSEATKEEYINHFNGYDSDVSLIVPVSTFNNLEKVTECCKHLNTI